MLFRENKKRVDDVSRQNCEKLLERVINDDSWDQIMYETKKITPATKLWAFQYRLNSFAMVTNCQLKKWGIKTTEICTCTFCAQSIETYLHMFHYCEQVNENIWRPLKKWLDYFCYIQLRLDPYENLLGKY